MTWSRLYGVGFRSTPVQFCEDDIGFLGEERNAILALEVGETYTDTDGDTWERIE